MLILVTNSGSDIWVARCMFSQDKERAESNLAAGAALLKIYLTTLSLDKRRFDASSVETFLEKIRQQQREE